MADSLPNYSAREVAAAWGTVILDGFAEDNICEFSYNTDLTSEKVSCDGKLSTSITADRTGTVVVELMANSKSNRVLGAIVAAQNALADSSTIIRADFAVSDPSGQVLCIARNAYLKNTGMVSLGAEVGTQEWTFYSEKLDYLPAPRGSILGDEESAEMAATIAAMIALGSR